MPRSLLEPGDSDVTEQARTFNLLQRGRAVIGPSIEARVDAHERWLDSRARDGERLALADVQLVGVDLAGRRLVGAHLVRVSLRGARLAEIDLAESVLEDVDLREADLSRALLMSSTGQRIRADGARLTEAEAHRVQWTDATLCGAWLEDVEFARAELLRCDLTRADLSGARLRSSRLSECVLQRARLLRADLSMAVLADVDLRQARLEGAMLVDAVLARVRVFGSTGPLGDTSGLRCERIDRTPEGSDPVGADGEAWLRTMSDT